MSTICEIGLINDDKSIDIIYCSWDGNLIGTGRILNERYKNIDKVSSLIAKHYTIKSLDEPVVSKDSKTHHFGSMKEYENHINNSKDTKGDGRGISYFYIFDGNKWLVSCINNNYEMQSLSRVLSDSNSDQPDAKLTAGDTSLLRTPVDIVSTVKSTSSGTASKFKDACINAEGNEVKGVKEFAAVAYMINKSVKAIEDFYKSKGSKLHLAAVDKKVNVSVSGDSILVNAWAAKFKIESTNINDVQVTYMKPKFDKNVESDGDISIAHRDVVLDTKKNGGENQTLDDAIKFNIDDSSEFSTGDNVDKYMATSSTLIADLYIQHLNDIKSRGSVFMESRYLTFNEFLHG